jgi:hypothetical protein
MATLAPVLLLSVPGLVASPRHLRVDISIQGVALPPAFVSAAIEEAADIWSAYGVEIRIPDVNDAEQDRPVRLAVTLSPPPEALRAGTLGSIVFKGDAPEPTIELYPSAASALVAGIAFNSLGEPWPAGLKDRAVARVLGRALAHEVGHFLLRSKRHSTDGLMKAKLVASDLASPDRRRFALSADDVRQFRAMMLSTSEASGE